VTSAGAVVAVQGPVTSASPSIGLHPIPHRHHVCIELQFVPQARAGTKTMTSSSGGTVPSPAGSSRSLRAVSQTDCRSDPTPSSTSEDASVTVLIPPRPSSAASEANIRRRCRSSGCESSTAYRRPTDSTTCTLSPVGQRYDPSDPETSVMTTLVLSDLPSGSQHAYGVLQRDLHLAAWDDGRSRRSS
jgi:hypothetical protein